MRRALAMAYQWTTPTKLEYRLGSAMYRRLYDDDGDGSADTNPVAQLIEESSGYVAGYLRGIYDLAAVDAAVAAESINEVQRLTLDVCEARACRRYPETARNKNWQQLQEIADDDLMRLRKQIVRLDIEGTPEPAATNGGDWGQGDPDLFSASDPPWTFSRNGFGRF